MMNEFQQLYDFYTLTKKMIVVKNMYLVALKYKMHEMLAISHTREMYHPSVLSSVPSYNGSNVPPFLSKNTHFSADRLPNVVVNILKNHLLNINLMFLKMTQCQGLVSLKIYFLNFLSGKV